MTTYSVIIGSPPGGSTFQIGAFGSLGCLTKDSTPAERLNMAFRFGKAGSASKSGCMKARYSISAGLPASGQMRTSRSESCSWNVSRHVWALPRSLLGDGVGQCNRNVGVSHGLGGGAILAEGGLP